MASEWDVGVPPPYGSVVVIDGVSVSIVGLASPDSPPPKGKNPVLVANTQHEKRGDEEAKRRKRLDEICRRNEELYARTVEARKGDVRYAGGTPLRQKRLTRTEEHVLQTKRHRNHSYDIEFEEEGDARWQEEDEVVRRHELVEEEEEEEEEPLIRGEMTARDSNWVEECPGLDNPAAKPEEKWYPKLDPWRRDMELLLQPGELEDPVACFGCCYEELSGRNVVYVEKWNELLQAFKEGLMNIGRISNLGRQLYQIFSQTVLARLIADARRQPKLRSLQVQAVWSPYGLTYHLMYHNADPEIRHYKNMMRVRAATDTIFDNEMYQCNAVSGRVRVSEPAIAKLEKVLRIEMSMQKMKPSSMAFANKSRALAEHGYGLLGASVPKVARRELFRTHERWTE